MKVVKISIAVFLTVILVAVGGFKLYDYIGAAEFYNNSEKVFKTPGVNNSNFVPQGMTYDEESYLLDSIKQIKKEVHENNIMLNQMVEVINNWLINANQENENDFGRNVIANLISSFIDIGLLNKR